MCYHFPTPVPAVMTAEETSFKLLWVSCLSLRFTHYWVRRWHMLPHTCPCCCTHKDTAGWEGGICYPTPVHAVVLTRVLQGEKVAYATPHLSMLLYLQGYCRVRRWHMLPHTCPCCCTYKGTAGWEGGICYPTPVHAVTRTLQGEKVAYATPHLSMLLYTQGHCCPLHQQLPSNFGDFSHGVCHVVMITSAQSNSDMERHPPAVGISVTEFVMSWRLITLKVIWPWNSSTPTFCFVCLRSDIVGVPGLKRDKFSVFTFLSVPTQDPHQPATSSTKATPQAKETTSKSHKADELDLFFLCSPLFTEVLHTFCKRWIAHVVFRFCITFT